MGSKIVLSGGQLVVKSVGALDSQDMKEIGALDDHTMTITTNTNANILIERPQFVSFLTQHRVPLPITPIPEPLTPKP